MCTSIAMKTDDFYFGRNMDIYYSFGERVVFTPRNYPFTFTSIGTVSEHYAIIGMATVIDGYPLYADAVNEKGLCMAALDFPRNAYYKSNADEGKIGVAQYEILPYLLSRCASVSEVKEELRKIQIVDIPFNVNVPSVPLHFHIADKNSGITVEQTSFGLNVYDNEIGVLTNNPEFPFHRENLLRYTNICPYNTENALYEKNGIEHFGQGLGSVGLPGDFSSPSRFVKAAYLLSCRFEEREEKRSVAHFFRILSAVAPLKGSMLMKSGEDDMTVYTCCMNADKGIYYYTTYFSHKIESVSFSDCNLSTDVLAVFELKK